MAEPSGALTAAVAGIFAAGVVAIEQNALPVLMAVAGSVVAVAGPPITGAWRAGAMWSASTGVSVVIGKLVADKLDGSPLIHAVAAFVIASCFWRLHPTFVAALDRTIPGLLSRWAGTPAESKESEK